MEYFYGILLLEGEEVRQVNGFDGRYYISNKGRLFSIKGTPKLRKCNIDKRGYYKTTLSIRTNQEVHRVHRLVASAFIPNPKHLPFINHKDGNPLNNHVSNLEWCTPKENCRHAISIGKNTRGKKGKLNTSGYVGVSWDKWYGKWVAQISVFGELKKLGFYEDKIDAAKAYDSASVEFHGETGRRNF